MHTNLQVKAFRTKGCEHFNFLGLIFGKSTTTCRLVDASTQVSPNSNEERELDEEFITCQKRSSASLDGDLEGPFPFPRKKIGSSSRDKKESKSSKMNNTMDAWAAFSLARMEKYKHTCPVNIVNDAYKINTCMDVLEGMEGVGSQ
ncbi:unnamed protein product [Ilex paraguariensis]|uniref:Uncharacterized protein n=1 Tax=Ilex paraguariensis TaxID=185542 RepID=A0ABC8TQC0_9AQUA